MMISVLIVSYEGREHLRHCLEELEKVRDPPTVEIVVVDNASRDGSPEMVARDFPTVRLLELPSNVGFGAANNRAAELARGEAFLLLNSDAWLAGGALEALAAELDRDPRVAAVVPRLHYPDGRRQFAWAPETGVWGEAVQKVRNRHEDAAWIHRLPPAWLRPVLGPGWLSAACLLVRRRAFEEIGGFDEDIFLYFEDVDLGRRLRLAGWRFAVADGAIAYHVKGGSRPSDRGEIEYRRAQLYYYAKHRPAWENRFLRFKMRRKFARVDPEELRRELLALLDT